MSLVDRWDGYLCAHLFDTIIDAIVLWNILDTEKDKKENSSLFGRNE